MTDITKEPYAEWLEASLRVLAELKPETIGIVSIMPDGSTGTHYYMADNRDRVTMVEAILVDNLEELLRANADSIRAILNEEEGEWDGEA